MKDIIFHEVRKDTLKDLQQTISNAIRPAVIPVDHAMVQVADLPFYETFKLYAVTDLRLANGKVYEILIGPEGAYLLDGAMSLSTWPMKRPRSG